MHCKAQALVKMLFPFFKFIDDKRNMLGEGGKSRERGYHSGLKGKTGVLTSLRQPGF